MNYEKQSIKDLIFNPMLYTEYPYHWQDENGTIIFSKKPRYNFQQILDFENKIKNLKIKKHSILDNIKGK